MITTNISLDAMPQGIAEDQLYKSTTTYLCDGKEIHQITRHSEPTPHPERVLRKLFRTLHYTVSANTDGVTVRAYVPHAEFERGAQLADLISTETELVSDYFCTADFLSALPKAEVKKAAKKHKTRR